MAVSRALSLIEIGNRMKLCRAEGLDELFICRYASRVWCGRRYIARSRCRN